MHATFPSLARWRSIRFWTVGNALSPQQGLTGAETIVPVPRARWMATGEAVIRGEDGFQQWQGFLAQMEGVVGTTLVPCQSMFRPRDRLARALPLLPGVADAIPRVVTVAAAPLRSREIDVEFVDTIGLLRGHHFSIGPRLHHVQDVELLSDRRATVRFIPPLRAPVEAGVALEVANPVCKMRFVAETEGVLPQSYGAPNARVTVNFQEAL